MINIDYISDILEFIKEKNYERILEIISIKNRDFIQKHNQKKIEKETEVNSSINNINIEIENLESSLSKIISKSESAENAKEFIILYIKNLKKKKNNLIIQKKTI